jgi:hypothetical protein
METALLVAAILIAGLACPAVMLWQRRRGRAAACCAPPGEEPSQRAEEQRDLRRGHAALSAPHRRAAREALPLKVPAGHRNV